MHLKKTTPLTSEAETPRRNSRNSIRDAVDTYKQTVKKLVNDRKELSKMRDRMFSNGNIVSINRASHFNSPVQSQMVIPGPSQGNI